MQSHVSYYPQYKKMTSKYMANMVNATFASLSTPPGIYYVCHIFTPQCLHICDIFTESKFVQIHFFSQCKVIMKLSSFDQKLYLCFELGKETIQKNIVVNIKMFFFVGKIYSQLNPVINLARFTCFSKP